MDNEYSSDSFTNFLLNHDFRNFIETESDYLSLCTVCKQHYFSVKKFVVTEYVKLSDEFEKIPFKTVKLLLFISSSSSNSQIHESRIFCCLFFPDKSFKIII